MSAVGSHLAGTGVTEAPGKLATCDLLQLDNSCQSYTNTHTCAMVPASSDVLSAMKK